MSLILSKSSFEGESAPTGIGLGNAQEASCASSGNTTLFTTKLDTMAELNPISPGLCSPVEAAELLSM